MLSKMDAKHQTRPPLRSTNKPTIVRENHADRAQRLAAHNWAVNDMDSRSFCFVSPIPLPNCLAGPIGTDASRSTLSRSAFVPDLRTTTHSAYLPNRHVSDRTRWHRDHLPLSMTSSPPGASSKKIAVVGAGISGLSMALALIRTSQVPASCITVYDNRKLLDSTQGGAFNLSGGAAILKNVYDVDLRPHAVSLSDITCRSTVSSSRIDTLYDFPVRKVIETQRALVDRDDGKSMLLTIMRADLQRILSEQLEQLGCEVRRGDEYKVINVERDGVLCFADASKVQFDLVIGADGVKSIVRNTMNVDNKRRYSGFRVYWAVDCHEDFKQSVRDQYIKYGELKQWFGSGVYVIHYLGGSKGNEVPLLSIAFQDSSYVSNGDGVKENESYMTSDVLQDGLNKMKRTNMPQHLLDQYSNAKRLVDTPVYEYEAKKWSSEEYRTVLVGDSGHSITPFLGQGANQAIQDAYVLSKCIASNDYDYWAAIKEYEGIRKSPTTALVKASWFVGNLETQRSALGTFARDNLFKTFFKVGVLQKLFVQSCTPNVGKYEY